MAKTQSRNRSTEADERTSPTPAAKSDSSLPLEPPKRRPVLLAVAILLFTVWFVYLLVMAIT